MTPTANSSIVFENVSKFYGEVLGRESRESNACLRA